MRAALVGLGLLAVLIVPARAGQTCQGAASRSEADFAFLAGGAQVHDRKNGLVWARCLEAQSWNGSTCVADDPKAVNPGPRLTHADALKLAASKATKEEPWRLPTKAELLTLREKDCHNPSLNLKLFPTEPAWSSDGAFWTSSREAEGVSVVDAIGASDGWSRTDASRTNHVRLVRTAPKTQP